MDRRVVRVLSDREEAVETFHRVIIKPIHDLELLILAFDNLFSYDLTKISLGNAK